MPEIDDLVVKYLPAYERWLTLRARVPVRFQVKLPAELKAGEPVVVDILENDRRHQLGVELLAVLPDYFVRGTLTEDAVRELAPLLLGIIQVTGRSPAESVALLATFQVFVLDTLRLNESVGIREVWTTFDKEILPGVFLEDDWSAIFAPEFSPQKIRALWDTAVLPFLHWYLSLLMDVPGVIYLNFIPPARTEPMSPEQYEALVERTNEKVAQSILRLYGTYVESAPGTAKTESLPESEKCAEITRRFREHYRKHGRKKDYSFVLLDYSYRHEELKFPEAVRQFLELYGHPEPDAKPKSVTSSAYGYTDEHELDIGDKSLSDADWLLERTEKDIREKFDSEP